MNNEHEEMANIIRTARGIEKRMNTPGTPEHANLVKQAEAYRLSREEPVPSAEEMSSMFWKSLAKDRNNPEKALAAWVTRALGGPGHVEQVGFAVVPQEGATVKLVGLVGKAVLNGRLGTLQRALIGSDGLNRWLVSIHDVEETTVARTSARDALDESHHPQTQAAETHPPAPAAISVRPANLIVLKGGRVETPAGTLDVTTAAGATVLGQLCDVKGHDPVDAVQKALSFGCNPNKPCLFVDDGNNRSSNSDGGTPNKDGDVGREIVKVISHPLAVAASSGHHDTCELLLKANASTTNKDAGGYTALHYACKNIVGPGSNTGILTLLLAHGADTADDDGGNVENVLRFAAKRNNVDAIKVLLASGMHVDVVSEATELHTWYRTSLMEALHGGAAEAALTLIAAGASLDMMDSYGRSAFHIAAAHGSTRVAEACLSMGGIDIDAYTAVTNAETRQKNAPNKSKTALHIAVVADDVDMVSCLLKHGASVDLKTQSPKEGYDPKTALELAIGGQNFTSQGEGVLEGLVVDVEVQAVNRRQRAFPVEYLRSRVGINNGTIIKMLLAHGAACDVERAVRIAATAGNIFALGTLLQKCKPVGATSLNSNGMTALDLAASHSALFAATLNSTSPSKFADTVGFFLDQPSWNDDDGWGTVGSDGADADATAGGNGAPAVPLEDRDRKAWMESALWHAAHFGHIDTARVLLDHDATLNINTFAGRETTLLMESSKEGHFDMVLFLLNRGADPAVENMDGLHALIFARDDAAVLMAMYVWGCGCPTVAVADDCSCGLCQHLPHTHTHTDAIMAKVPKVRYFEANTPTFVEIAKRFLLNKDSLPLEGLGPRRQQAIELLCKQATAEEYALKEAASLVRRANIAAIEPLLQMMFPGVAQPPIEELVALAESQRALNLGPANPFDEDTTAVSFRNAGIKLQTEPWSVSKHWFHTRATKDKVRTIFLMANRFANEAVAATARGRDDLVQQEGDEPFRSLWLPTELWICGIIPFVQWTPSLPATGPTPVQTAESEPAAEAPPTPQMSFSIRIDGAAVAGADGNAAQPPPVVHEGECTVM